MSALVFTVGHSTHSSEWLKRLLLQHGITAIADVRSQPYSRANPQFNREPLKDALKVIGISYVFLGRELGARTDDSNCYVEGKVQYERLAKTHLFQHGLTRVINGTNRYRIALLCAEKDPLTCHRTILVVRHLVARGLRAAHILEDGRLEHHEDAIERLLKEIGLGERDFFKPREVLLDEAYARRESEIAYVEKPDSAADVVLERYAP